ncbi:hypothetical protein DPV78_003639 [Talaromyces pinophilus]|nr:hypothetical protein DPV78_003639 [Talaromyces pinophilus]
MASPTKPTILLVHGAFHGPECFDALISPLEAAGYTSIKNDLKLPSTELNSSSSLQQDIDILRTTVLQILDGVDGATGSDCVVVMHSYSAVPAAEALRGLSRSERGDITTAVLKMVYLSCNIPKVGDSHLSQMTKWMEEIGLSADLPVEASDDGVMKFTGDAEVFYNGLPEDQQATLKASLSTSSAATFTTPLKGSMAYEKIPGWYLISKKDNILPEAFQKVCISVVGDMMENVEEVDAGHSSFLVKPEIVADFIVRAVKSVS